MSTIFVTTQSELDAALKEHGDDWRTEIIIKSEPGVWLEVRAIEGSVAKAKARRFHVLREVTQEGGELK